MFKLLYHEDFVSFKIELLLIICNIKGGLGYVTENCVIDTAQAKGILEDLRDRKDMV
jgi:hypothetical protein